MWLGLPLALAFATPARAEPLRFAVVNLSPRDLPPPVVEEAEREYARLRGGAAAAIDASLRRLLITGETPDKSLPRLVEEASKHHTQGNCAAAIPPARQAENLALSSVPADDAREPLKRIYSLLVACEDDLGRAEVRDQAARHLRALVYSPPQELSVSLWDAYVKNAVAPPAVTEMQVDSEPANAQVILNFHAQGVTPRTLKVPPGEVLIEIQKPGYKKAFRKLEPHERPPRVAFRLADLRRDRIQSVAANLQLLDQESALEQRQRTLAQLAQLVRADTLMLLRAEASRIVIRFFDAERGAVTNETIISPFDPETGRIDVLANQQTEAKSEKRANVLAPALTSEPRPNANEVRAPAGNLGEGSVAHEETNRAALRPRPRPDNGTGPWWGWLIAAAVAGAIVAVAVSDQPRRADTINVNASF